MRTLRIVLGIAAWIAAVGGLGWHFERRLATPSEYAPSVTSELLQYAASRRDEMSLRFQQPAVVAVGDPIFVSQGDEDFLQVGEVSRLWTADAPTARRIALVERCEAIFYPIAPRLSAEAHLTHHQTPDSLAWVVETMLPPAKREQIAAELQAAFAAHHQEILTALRPVVERGLREAAVVVKDDLLASLKRHRSELEDLGGKYQSEIVEKELTPLIQDEIWPIVRRHAEPVANDVGKQIWDRAPKFNLLARYVYDRSILPQRGLFKKGWDEFVENEIVPILEDHTGEFLEVQQKIVVDVARNEKVRQVVRGSVKQVLDDPEFRALVAQLMRETFVESPRLREVFDKHWRSDEARRALKIAAERFEPTVRRIGDLVFGSEEAGISPEFAAVLRNQILQKDRRWLVLNTSARWPPNSLQPVKEDLVLKVYRGKQGTPSPFAAAAESATVLYE